MMALKSLKQTTFGDKELLHVKVNLQMKYK